MSPVSMNARRAASRIEFLRASAVRRRRLGGVSAAGDAVSVVNLGINPRYQTGLSSTAIELCPQALRNECAHTYMVMVRCSVDVRAKLEHIVGEVRGRRAHLPEERLTGAPSRNASLQPH